MVDIDLGYKQAIQVVRKCSKDFGIYASGTKLGYTAVWARDSMITLLGASLAKEAFIQKVFEKTLNLLSEYQSPIGQIPNAIDIFDLARRKPQVNFATLDSSLWYLLGQKAYSHNYHSNSLLLKHKKSVDKAFLWLKFQDSGEDGLPEQQPNADWQDAFPHKYGHVLNTQALYYAALKLYNHDKEAEKVKGVVNGTYYKDKYLSKKQNTHPWHKALILYDDNLGYYLPFSWKDHDGIRETEPWFDSLGNLLAVTSKLADKEKASSILHYIDKHKIARPYPVKAIYPAIHKFDKEWHDYFVKCLHNPYEYLNAGIWPMIGSFYITALVTMKRFNKAEKELELLAEANKAGGKNTWRFSEWLHGINGKPSGSMYQAWSAGSYILAYESVKRRKVPIFSLY